MPYRKTWLPIRVEIWLLPVVAISFVMRWSHRIMVNEASLFGMKVRIGIRLHAWTNIIFVRMWISMWRRRLLWALVSVVTCKNRTVWLSVDRIFGIRRLTHLRLFILYSILEDVMCVYRTGKIHGRKQRNMVIRQHPAPKLNHCSRLNKIWNLLLPVWNSKVCFLLTAIRSRGWNGIAHQPTTIRLRAVMRRVTYCWVSERTDRSSSIRKTKANGVIRLLTWKEISRTIVRLMGNMPSTPCFFITNATIRTAMSSLSAAWVSPDVLPIRMTIATLPNLTLDITAPKTSRKGTALVSSPLWLSAICSQRKNSWRNTKILFLRSNSVLLGGWPVMTSWMAVVLPFCRPLIRMAVINGESTTIITVLPVLKENLGWRIWLGKRLRNWMSEPK